METELSELPLLVKIEKVVVIVASFAAMFPLLQYYGEADERRLNREATIILGYMGCLGSGGLQQGLGSDAPEGILASCARISEEVDSLR